MDITAVETYIYERGDWPQFRWDEAAICRPLAAVRYQQGLLLGKLGGLGFDFAQETVLGALTEEVQQSSEIEGERLDRAQVRSSVARRLGLDVGALVTVERHVDGVVEVVLDATQHYATPLTAERLCGWQAALFPSGFSGLYPIRVGQWRDDSRGAMQVVSRSKGREHVHFQAPPAARLGREMEAFLQWFEGPAVLDGIVKAAIAHLWFVTIHPFEDGNGRIARAVADMALARSEETARRAYSMSAQIRIERDEYYTQLEQTQKGSLDVTSWVVWFLGCLQRAIERADQGLEAVRRRARFWEWLAGMNLNERQRRVVGRLLDGFEGKLTTVKWAALGKCSHDTALRDIQDLVGKGILVQEAAGRSTHYGLADWASAADGEPTAHARGGFAES